jgi:tripartite-type tricarboxylate transporter receptor subunit TctC
MHTHMLRTIMVTSVVIAIAIAGTGAGAGAATFPERPVRIVAASAPGGGTDIIARLLASKLSDLWKQQVIVDNRAGGGGQIATDIVAKAVPDGYTLLVQGNGISYTPYLYKKLPFDVKRDMVAITMVGNQPFVLAVHPSLPAKSIAELVQLAKAKPAELRFSSGGVGGSSHLGTELFRYRAGVNMLHVPYKGTGPGVTAILNKEVHLGMAGVGTMVPHIQSGKLRGLAVTGAKRSPAAPELPTIAENGLPGYAYDVWYGLFAPANTPRDVLNRINATANEALRDPETVKRFASAGIDVMGGNVEESNRYLQAEMVTWEKVIREAGIQAD